MTRVIRWYDYITFNIYFFGLTTLSQTMGLVTPLLVQQFVGEAQKGAYYGRFRLWTLMVALLAQALMGMLSDRSRSRWGRRRPFIFVGTLLNLTLTALIGFTSGMQGMTGYTILFLIAIVQQFASNMAHGAEQGILPDLVPEEKRGRFAGVKALLEIPLPMILVAFTIGKIISNGNLWGGLLVAMGVLLTVMLLTMLVPEKPLDTPPPPLDWQPFTRLLGMTLAFTAIILGSGQLVQLFSRLLGGTGSTTALFIGMGLLGVAGMVLAVLVGVLVSVRLSVGTEATKNPSFTWWVINRLAFLVGAVNLSTFAVYFLQARLGYERQAAAGPASKLIMFVGLFILVTTIPSGYLADRFGKKRMVILAGLIGAVGTVIALSVPNLNVIYVGGAVIGIAAGLFYTSNWALGTVLVPKAEAGRYLGISNLAGAGAGAVGAYIGGPIADYFTANAAGASGMGYVLLFSIYGLLFLFSVFAATRINEGSAIPNA